MRYLPRNGALAAALAIAASSLGGCGVNPVTGKSELQFVSEASELQMGQEQYAPTRQGEGGDLNIDPALTQYVREVGAKLAAVSDRKLPYEFVVLDSSVPNAWALPGGKIAVNRGLLPELKNEAELAAVLGHEITHAAARHGAKAQERGTLLQAGLAVAMIGAAATDTNGTLANLALQGAGAGAQMIQMKYGRDQELEADHYGMVYMQRAGYDLGAAVSLQETFVRLSQGKNQGWLDGLFASHPPSQERVTRNQATLAQLGGGKGDLGTERFAAKMAGLRRMKPAFDKYDQALALANKKDFTGARKLAGEAVQMLPREPRFTQLLGDLAMAQKQPGEAVGHYQKAIDLDPGYFGPYLGGGIAQFKLGNKPRAEEWLKKSSALLPTAPAAYYLGSIAKERGDTAGARQLFQAASGSQSEYGQLAAGEFQRMDLAQNPAQYLATAVRLDGAGQPVFLLQNRAQIAITGISITPVVTDAYGNIVQQGATQALRITLKPGETASVASGLAPMSAEQASSIAVRVTAAQPAP
ncbi:MAG: M48 family metalloprotease [Steroidobacteraceae bacterium]